MKQLFLAALIAATLSGCVASPKQITAMSNLSLCQAYQNARKIGHLAGDGGANHLQEIQRRKLLSDNELDLVKNKQIQRGMSTCALYASWGSPDRENSTVSARGTLIQHIYGWRRGASRSYVYTENGLVTSWQN